MAKYSPEAPFTVLGLSKRLVRPQTPDEFGFGSDPSVGSGPKGLRLGPFINAPGLFLRRFQPGTRKC